MFSLTSAAMAAWTCAVRSISLSSVASGSSCMERPYTSRRRYPVRYRAVSLKVFVGTPALLTRVPPGAARRSTMATRLPKNAAWAAAFSPAGPAPITTMSKLATASEIATATPLQDLLQRGENNLLAREDVGEVPHTRLVRKHLKQSARFRRARGRKAYTCLVPEIASGDRPSDPRHVAALQGRLAPHLNAPERGNRLEDNERTARVAFEMPQLDIV